jgi:arylsulfatase A-like enzyme
MKALVIILNRGRPDYSGCYGNDWLATPALDRLAADSVVFDQHFADAPQPMAARRSWDWGTFGYRRTPPLHTGFPHLFWSHSVSTWLIGSERSPTFGSDFASRWQMQRWVCHNELAAIDQDHLLGGTIQAAVDWLGPHGQQDNWLLWLELSALQPPWDEAEYSGKPAEDSAAEPWFNPPRGRPLATDDIPRLQQTYGGMMLGVDEWLGQLFDYLREKNLYDDLLIALTSDRGLPLGDHGYFGDFLYPWLHEELVHLPLIVKLPGGEQKGRRVQQLSQPVDLWPTLAAAFGAEIPDGSHGKNLLPLMHGESVKLREFCCSHVRRGRAREWSIRTHQWHFLLPIGERGDPPRGPQLYVKPDDRWEVNNVLSQHPDVAEHLELMLRRFISDKVSND